MSSISKLWSFSPGHKKHAVHNCWKEHTQAATRIRSGDHPSRLLVTNSPPGCKLRSRSDSRTSTLLMKLAVCIFNAIHAQASTYSGNCAYRHVQDVCYRKQTHPSQRHYPATITCWSVRNQVRYTFIYFSHLIIACGSQWMSLW
jgi:hypothetical protein